MMSAPNIFDAELEEFLLSQPTRSDERGPVFILGAPRTGSTILYQAMAAGLRLPYVANLTNDHYSTAPIVGLSIQAAWQHSDKISGESRYGKTSGPFQPSEGSALMRRWFGGGHPSELVSATIRPDQKEHLVRTMSAAWRLFGRPIVIKNAWNCFRIAELARLLPNSAFVWIRRDIVDSANSDLEARYAVHQDPIAWNSATPRNYEALKARPYWEQVVENQYEFARAISEGFAQMSADRHATVWYEDFCSKPAVSLKQLIEKMTVLSGFSVDEALPSIARQAVNSRLSPEDAALVTGYVASCGDRLADARFRGVPG